MPSHGMFYVQHVEISENNIIRVKATKVIG
jgi:hypothetical protein